MCVDRSHIRSRGIGMRQFQSSNILVVGHYRHLGYCMNFGPRRYFSGCCYFIRYVHLSRCRARVYSVCAGSCLARTVSPHRHFSYYVPFGIDMCVERVWTSAEACVGICGGMIVETCTDVCSHACRRVCTNVCILLGRLLHRYFFDFWGRLLHRHF